ncbi:DWNN domain-containing protein [Lipomyces oligophaga]|uniref:DWNN domain-containing protein n=1 Tax=Lipomyces oligophaga TaxID=45792 RepID=UPI0034CDCC81
MSSSIYYKFLSQRDMMRINFDGTGISVFDLKREIILANKLGDGTDFDLILLNPDTKEIYEDDSEILPRSLTVVAKRSAPSRSGRGTAVRYVNAKGPSLGPMPGIGGRGRNDFARKPLAPVSIPTITNGSNELVTEEDERISSMFEAQSENWLQTQESMANAAPVFSRTGNNPRQRPTPDYPPPATYVCHRCGQRGHWIQACPTNNDPQFEGRKVKPTTGIPKSFLKTVSKDELSAIEASSALDPNGISDRVRRNESGEYVLVQPNSAPWQSYRQRQNESMLDEDDQDQDSDRRRKRSRRRPN